MDGEIVYDYENRKRSSNVIVYFDRDDISDEYFEINIIATNNYYYGQFFFDEIFMDLLTDRASAINADAIIYEKDRVDYPNYNDEYIYFTAIRFIDK